MLFRSRQKSTVSPIAVKEIIITTVRNRYSKYVDNRFNIPNLDTMTYEIYSKVEQTCGYNLEDSPDQIMDILIRVIQDYEYRMQISLLKSVQEYGM